MSVSDDGGGALGGSEALDGAGQSRKEKRKALKKQKRKQSRRELALREREEEDARANDPEEQLRIRLKEREEADAAERERKTFEERERLWQEAAAARRAEEEQREEEARRERLLEDSQKDGVKDTVELGEDDEWEYVEEGPAEIIWKGNEIIVKKKQIKLRKRGADKRLVGEEDDRPTSNPFPPQCLAFEAFNSLPPVSAKEVLESVAQQVPNFGTEQDKAHCPFHLKTGACRFGMRCSRVHFYPDKSCTLLIKNMYNGPGIAWEQDEGLEYTDEEVERSYEEFYEDVHTEFLKFGEIVNFKVCRNSSFHLRGNVYIHYRNLESSILAYNTMNGRYYAGKQITCEFVNITRWKIAICGEYMKSRLKTCSHGTACNFIHCFHNPGGDYEWADWDNPPPRYWIKKMAVLFGPSDGPVRDTDLELEDQQLPRESSQKRTWKSDKHHSRRTRHSERDLSSNSGDDSDGSRNRYDSYRRRSYSRERRKAIDFGDKQERSVRSHIPEVDYSEHSAYNYDSGGDSLKAKDGGSSLKEEKNKERSRVEDHEKHVKKHKKSDSSSRLKGNIAGDVHGKSDKRSKYFEQQKRHDLHTLDDGNCEDNDGCKRGGHLRSRGKNYRVHDKHRRPSSFYLCSEREFTHEGVEGTYHFDGSDEFKENYRFSRSRHQSHHHKRDGENRLRRQEVKGEGFSPTEYSEDCRIGATESCEVHDKHEQKGGHRSHCGSEISDSRNSTRSSEKQRSVAGRKRHKRSREHLVMGEENGDSGSDGLHLENVTSRKHSG